MAPKRKAIHPKSPPMPPVTVRRGTAAATPSPAKRAVATPKRGVRTPLPTPRKNVVVQSDDSESSDDDDGSDDGGAQASSPTKIDSASSSTYADSIHRLMTMIAASPSYKKEGESCSLMEEVRQIVIMHQSLAEDVLDYLKGPDGVIVRTPPLTEDALSALNDASPKNRNLFLSAMLSSTQGASKLSDACTRCCGKGVKTFNDCLSLTHDNAFVMECCLHCFRHGKGSLCDGIHPSRRSESEFMNSLPFE